MRKAGAVQIAEAEVQAADNEPKRSTNERRKRKKVAFALHSLRNLSPVSVTKCYLISKLLLRQCQYRTEEEKKRRRKEEG